MKSYKKEFKIGDEYFYWKIINIHAHPNNHINGRWSNILTCVCQCGREVKKREYLIRRSQSCGCMKGNKKYHNLDIKSYSIWRNVKNRCKCKTMPSYQKYGAIGIKVCKGLSDYTFFKDLLGAPPSNTHSLDRFPDNYGNYSCGRCEECIENNWEENVRWATPKQQAENRKICYKVNVEGNVVTLKEACRIKNLPYKQVHERIKRGGWNIDIAINTPVIHATSIRYKQILNGNTNTKILG